MGGSVNDFYCGFVGGSVNDFYCEFVGGSVNDFYCGSVGGSVNKFFYGFVGGSVNELFCGFVGGNIYKFFYGFVGGSVNKLFCGWQRALTFYLGGSVRGAAANADEGNNSDERGTKSTTKGVAALRVQQRQCGRSSKVGGDSINGNAKCSVLTGTNI